MTRNGTGTVLWKCWTLHRIGLVSNRARARSRGLDSGGTKIRSAQSAVAFWASVLSLGGSLALANRNGAQSQNARDAASPAANGPSAQTQVTNRPHARSPIARPLAGPEELQLIFREVAEEAIKLAKSNPDRRSLALAHIAAVQVKAGDRIGANVTFAAALEQATGGQCGVAQAQMLSYIGRIQTELGMNDEARSTLRKSTEEIPALTGDFNSAQLTMVMLIVLIKSQVQAGDREHARENLKRLEQLVSDALRVAQIGNADAVMLPKLAGAQAAAGDYDGAFATVERVRTGGRGLRYKLGETLGEIVNGAGCLKLLEVRRFVRRVVEELDQIKDPAQTYFVLSDLAVAQARLGDFQAARRSAMAIGEPPSSGAYDVAGGQPYALLRIAMRQKEAGDLAGARENLRLGYESVRKHPKMREPSGRLLRIADAQILVGDLEGATRSVEAVKQGERAEVLARIALALAVSGQAEQARNTMDKTLRDAGLDPDDGKPTRPTVTYAPDREIAKLQAMAGLVDAALATARSIRDPFYRRLGLAGVVQSRAQAGDPLDALRLASGLESPDDRRMALERLAFGLSARLDLESPRYQAGSPRP